MPATALMETPEQRFEQDMLDWLEPVYQEAEQELSDSHELKLTGKIIDYICGRQWSPQARFGRSRPVNNRLFRQFVEMVGLLTDIEPDFQVKFYGSGEGFSPLEKLINNMISMWATMSDFEQEFSQTVIYGLIHTGYNKLQWNPAMFNGLGDNEYLPISPINLMEVGSQSNLQAAEMVINRTPVTMAYLKRRFGAVADYVRPESSLSQLPAQMMRPAKMPLSQWNKLSPTLKNVLGHKVEGISSKYPVALMKEFWFRDDSIWNGSESIMVGKEGTNWSYMVEPGMPLYPRGRVVITAGRKVLDDMCNPYWHGMFPFSKYRPLRVPWNKMGLSSLEPIAAIQNILNRINGGVMDTIQAAIEPSMSAPKAAFSQQTWDTLDPGAPGSKFQYNNNSPRPPEWRKPPELGSYVLPFAQELMKEQDATSGSAAIQQALNKKQVPGGDSIEMIMNAKSTNLRMMGRALTSYLTEVGKMAACNYLQFSSAKSRAAKFGGVGLMDSDFTKPFGEMIPYGMKPEEFVRQMGFSIRKGSTLSIEKSDEFQAAVGLRKMGDMSRKGLYRASGKNIDVAEIEKELLEEAEIKIKLGAAANAAAPHKGHK